MARLDWIDVARGYGMFFVFYGHLVERFATLALPTAFLQFKFIYSFHMPLFFVLAGLLAPERVGFRSSLYRGLLTRVLPALFFNILLIPLWMPPSPFAAADSGRHIGGGLLLLLAGKPILNYLTWFLFCLFIVEVLHALLRRFVRGPRGVAVAITLLFGIGAALAANLGPIVRSTGLPLNFWMLHEAAFALAFHQCGYLARTMGALEWVVQKRWALALFLLSSVAVYFTFDLNQGPFRSKSKVVLMSVSDHGDIGLFVLTALAGTLAVVALAMLTPRFRPMGWIGKQSLVFLGLNGFFFLLNMSIARSFLPYRPTAATGPLALFLEIGCIAALTLVSLLLTAPVAAALTHFFPQLVGQPFRDGPLLPSLPRNIRSRND